MLYFCTVPWSTSYFTAGALGPREENLSYIGRFGELIINGRLHYTNMSLSTSTYYVKTESFFPPYDIVCLETQALFRGLYSFTNSIKYCFHGPCETIAVFHLNEYTFASCIKIFLDFESLLETKYRK